MKPKYSYRICCLVLVLCICSLSLGCNNSSLAEHTNASPQNSISWFDADGMLLATETTDADYDPTTKELPSDTDLWHYTGWTLSKSGNITVCTAKRLSKTKVIWKDFDGTLLKEDFFVDGEKEPTFDLPSSDEHWIYTEWIEESSKNEIVYTAKKTPNIKYFQGNVFQIIVNDQQGEPLGSGSGFIINDEGWFITNAHVMENGYSANAFFDIPDTVSGTKYTSLTILGGVYSDAKKDIFIGKINNYQNIKSHYQSISFTETYSEGDVCYSVGYPNSSVTLAINEGTVLEEYSNIYDKINGIYYILSDSYIAPGSSGGILINQDFQVIGITSMGLYSDESHSVYISGGSIPCFIFASQLKNLNDENLKALNVI